jgi:hypothetical protein
LFFTTGVLQAASLSKPGDLLYKVALKLEEIEVSLAQNVQREAELHLQHSTKRLDEVELLLEERDIETALSTLKLYEAQISQLDSLLAETTVEQSDSLLEIVYVARTRHLDVLTSLLEKVPDTAQDAIQHAIEVSTVADPFVSNPIDTPPLVQPDPEDSPGTGRPDDLPQPPGKTPKPPSDAPGKPQDVGPPEDPGPPDGPPKQKTLPPPAQGNPGGKP